MEIVGWALLGLFLMGIEVIVPGGILGILGVVSFIIAAVKVHVQFGAFWAVVSFFSLLATACLIAWLLLKWLSETKWRKSFFLEKCDSGTTQNHIPTLKNSIGVALSRLAPSGTVCIDKKNYPAITQAGLIQAGEKVKVIQQSDSKITVEHLNATKP